MPATFPLGSGGLTSPVSISPPTISAVANCWIERLRGSGNCGNRFAQFPQVLPLRSEVDALLGDGLALGLVEAAVVDRPFAGRRAGILHDQELAAGRGMELAFNVGIGMEHH